jgi:hypothetical protein
VATSWSCWSHFIKLKFTLTQINGRWWRNCGVNFDVIFLKFIQKIYLCFCFLVHIFFTIIANHFGLILEFNRIFGNIWQTFPGEIFIFFHMWKILMANIIFFKPRSLGLSHRALPGVLQRLSAMSIKLLVLD